MKRQMHSMQRCIPCRYPGIGFSRRSTAGLPRGASPPLPPPPPGIVPAVHCPGIVCENRTLRTCTRSWFSSVAPVAVKRNHTRFHMKMRTIYDMEGSRRLVFCAPAHGFASALHPGEGETPSPVPTPHWDVSCGPLSGTVRENRTRDIDICSRIFIRCACSPSRDFIGGFT